MIEKTKQDYLKIANNFLTERLINNNLPVTQKTIKHALIASAPDYCPAYWRRLRRALVVLQVEAGFNKTAKILKRVRNPITLADAPSELKSKKKKKQKRRKHVEKEEHFQLKAYFENKMDHAVLAAIEIARILGCRPAEMLNLKMFDNNQIFITGAKKTARGTRGLDRTVIVSERDYNIISSLKLSFHEEINFNRHKGKSERAMHRIQHRLATATKNLWPRRKHQITLYSYRHQMGSDLKASSISRKEVAVIMGHQSVDSIDVYGNKRLSSRSLSIRATARSIVDVRETKQRRSKLIVHEIAVNDANKNREDG